MTRRQLALAALAAARASPGAAQAPGLPGVVLLDQDGTGRPLADLARGRAVVLGFFFTGCATICPPQTAAMQALQEELTGQPGTRPLLLSISLDPLGDTPQAMRAYAARFGLALGAEPGWFLLGGDPRALLRVWTAFEQPTSRPEEHAAQLWLGAPEGRPWRRVGALTPTGRLLAMLREMAG
jgi:protein SCO1